MPHSISYLALVIGSSALFCAGTVFIGRYVKNEHVVDIAIAAISLIFANFLYIQLMRIGGFSYSYVITSMCVFAVMLVISIFVFEEALNWQKCAAFLLAMAAIGVYSIPSQAGGLS